MERGTLRIYVGPAPGVGKTYAMLDEGARRAARGTDVVIGLVETHGRVNTAAMIGDLEVTPRITRVYRGSHLEEMDVAAIIARRPSVCLIDEYAHSNVPGSGNAKRWQDVEQILAAGIDVITTLNIQHLESVNDVIERITGVRQRETIPDAVVRRADQIELVDMSPEALRRRLAHGNIYAAEKIDAALANYFRPGNLGALREIALLWTADRVDEALEHYRELHGIDHTWETKERIVAAMTGTGDGDQLIRRAWRAATRAHGELIGVHVRAQHGLSTPDTTELAHQRELLQALGGTYREVAGSDVAEALVAVARAENATRVYLGTTRRSRLQEYLHGSVINRIVRLAAGDFDVAVIGREGPSSPWRPPAMRLPSALAPRRRWAGVVIAALLIVVLTPILTAVDSNRVLPTALLLYLAVVVVVAAVGGLGPALAAAIVCFGMANWFFTPPVHALSIDKIEDLVALLVFLGVAAVVSAFVELAARRSAQGAAAHAEAEALFRIAGHVPIDRALDGLVRAFALSGAAVLHKTETGWVVDAAAADAPTSPDHAAATLDLDPSHVLVTKGAVFRGSDSRVVAAFAKQLAAAIEMRELEDEAGQADALARSSELRASLLAAVSHDLRTPLAAVRAAVTSLMETDVHWSKAEVDDFLATIDTAAARLDGLLGNLLDMSRIETGALTLTKRAVGLDEVLPVALHMLGLPDDQVEIAVSESLPAVTADPGLLERVLANVIANAAAHSPPHQPVRVAAEAINGNVEVRVVDRGPGIPVADRERAFAPFQRFGDARGGVGGVGLGLAVAKGFVTAMDGTIDIEDTPGGGATLVIVLKAAP